MIVMWKKVLCVISLSLISSYAEIAKKCPEFQVHFEKILGFRPPTVSSLSSNYGAPFEERILFKANHQVPSVINLQCMELCRNDYNCDSYVLNFNKSECYGFTSNEKFRGKHSFRRFDDHDLVEDISVVFFVKTCLNIPMTCKSTLWPLLRIPGTSLVSRGYLTVNKLMNRRECIERCLFETSFKCRSVSFQISYRNNMARTNFANILNKEILGRCILSRDDKNTEPDSFRVAQVNDEYIENQCQVVTNGVEEQFLDELCAYEYYPDSALIYAERSYIGLSDRECQEKCFKENFFFCKGLTYQKMDGVDNSRCFIHSEDVISMGPRAVVPMINTYYMKRVQCLNLNVRCTQTDMIIRYHPRQYFQGRIYTEGHADECSVSGSNYGPTFLTLPIGSQPKEQRCSIHRAFDYESPNRTLLFTYIIIQNNPLVMMQSDRYIKVGCISRFNRSSSEGLPDIVSLETSMEFGSKDFDGSGSLLIDNGGDIPKLTVEILDPLEDTPIKEAKIGQILKMVISMESYDNSNYKNYDLRAFNLTASSEFDRMELIGPTGCPNNAAIFPAFQHESTISSKRIVTKFKAFKFASSSATLHFSVAIQFCYKECKPRNCGNGIISHGRKKRQAESAPIVNKSLNLIIFPDQLGSDSSTLGRIIFPGDETSTSTTSETPAPLRPIIFPGPSEKLTEGNELAPGVRVDAFGNLQGIQQYLSGIKEIENEFPDDDRGAKARNIAKVVTVPLYVVLNVVEPEVNGTDRLVIGDSDHIYVAGLVTTASLCLDQSLITAIVIFWIIFQILTLLGCCIMARRYQKFHALEDDRRSLGYDDSLDNRHVRWADQRSQIHDAYFR